MFMFIEYIGVLHISIPNRAYLTWNTQDPAPAIAIAGVRGKIHTHAL